ncbi:LuxQ periplasmic sensor domain-containing protein [Salinivibrio sp. ES.052]|uniref:LuxQ periplasmic sensor domain-containing protein n=1 Tax=Salinivibrio sp. ES.052 TaxID=1882823 RepID=UPI00092A7D38|nr:LuxQ periplasmic sensor domain-containing protein [Salinivibrio sp. ES.052]SIO02357.1 signal transduction histidine kinase [Salinivibrio sp. ES.052]
MPLSGSPKLSLSQLLTRLIVVFFLFVTVGVYIQSYQLTLAGINQEITRTLTQTSRLLQNVFDSRLTSLQIHQNTNAASMTLQSLVNSEDSYALDDYFIEQEQQDVANTPDFRFIAKDDRVLWHDGSSLFHGIDSADLERLRLQLRAINRWTLTTMTTDMEQSYLLMRKTPIVFQANGKLGGYLYVVVMLNGNFSFVKSLQRASGTQAVWLSADNVTLASTLSGNDDIGNDLTLPSEESSQAFRHYLVSQVKLRIAGEPSKISLLSAQRNDNVIALQRQMGINLLLTTLVIIVAAFWVNRFVKTRIADSLDKLMRYTQGARSRQRTLPFGGSDIEEFNHIGKTLESTFDALYEKERSLQDLFDYALSPIIVWDTDFEITRINPAAKLKLNYDEQIHTSSWLYDQFMYAISPHLKRAVNGTILKGVNIDIDRRVYRWNLAPLMVNNQVKAVIGQGQEITSLIEAEQQSQRAKEAAEASARAKSEFLAKMSHEIRTPLNGILGITQILNDRAEDKAQKELLGSLYQSGEHLLTVLNDILDLSKIEQGKMTIEYGEFYLLDIIRTVENIYTPLCESKHISLNIDAPIAADTMVRSDQSRLTQILFNLMSNAIKFTHVGQVGLTVTLNQRETKNEDPQHTHRPSILRFEVSDTGVGMNQQALESLFDPFVQADSSVTRTYGGSGLGLSIVKSLLDLLEGEIDVTSEPEKGSHFVVDVPLTLVDEKPEKAPEEEPFDPALLGIERVLLVEDNKINAMVAQAFCHKYHIDVEWVKDGEQALASLDHAHYDLVLMDNHMPNLGGVEATRAIRETLGLSVPIYACTADAYGSVHEAFYRAGANYVIVKPIKEASFIEALRHLKQMEHTPLS